MRPVFIFISLFIFTSTNLFTSWSFAEQDQSVWLRLHGSQCANEGPSGCRIAITEFKKVQVSSKDRSLYAEQIFDQFLNFQIQTGLNPFGNTQVLIFQQSESNGLWLMGTILTPQLSNLNLISFYLPPITTKAGTIHIAIQIVGKEI